MSELSTQFDLSPSTVTGIVDRMVHFKLLKRIVPEEDRRAVELELDYKGNKIYHKSADIFEKRIFKMLTVLSEEEQKQLFTILKKVLSNIE
jgi:MarR family transcriptional regulator, organic hydroperoxide resistance regulator